MFLESSLKLCPNSIMWLSTGYILQARNQRGAHRRTPPCSSLYIRPKNKFAPPPPPVLSDNLYCLRPPVQHFLDPRLIILNQMKQCAKQTIAHRICENNQHYLLCFKYKYATGISAIVWIKRIFALLLNTQTALIACQLRFSL